MSLPPTGSHLVPPVNISPSHSPKDEVAILLGTLVPKKIEGLKLTDGCDDKTNVNADKAHESVMVWVRKYGQLGPVKLGEVQFERVDESRAGFLLGRAHPEAPKELLNPIAKFGAWLFVYDDIVEKFKDKNLVQSWHDRTMEIINGAEAREKDDGLMRGLFEIMTELKPYCSLLPEWRARFSEKLLAYTKATQWEIDNRINDRNPSVAEYKKNRFDTSGTEIMFCFSELVKKVTLLDEIFKREDFNVVYKAAVEIVNYANDIISAPKETKDGRHNLVFAYKHEKGCSFNDAIDFAASDLMDAIHKFQEGRKKYEGPCKEAVEILFAGIKEWDDANFLWSIKWSESDSERYVRHWAVEYQNGLR